MLTVISRFVMCALHSGERRRAYEAAEKSPADRPGFVHRSRLDHTRRQWLACPVVLGCFAALPPGARVPPACELDDCLDASEAEP
jgi:hypothetical protein